MSDSLTYQNSSIKPIWKQLQYQFFCFIMNKMQREYSGNLPEVFMFINSESGGGIGKELIGLSKDKLVVDVPASQQQSDKDNLVTVSLNLFDLRISERQKQGFQMVKKYVQDSRKIILVICGGDGTVMWVVSELKNHEIDHLKVPLAVLPLGTGNDLSRVLNWGKQCPKDLLSNNFAKLKKRISYWMSAEDETLDIWMVEAEVHDYGKFQKVSNKKSEELKDTKKIKHHFCNYFSVGIDGKVGYSFDTHRTSSRIGNMLVYGAMGIAKSCSRTKKIGQLTQSFKQINLEIQIKCSNIQSARPLSASDKLILKKGSIALQEIEDNQNLLFLNINSFMAGCTDIWENAEQPKIALEKMGPQSHKDGKIQVVSFGGVMALGMQKQIGGFANRVFQGTGPFSFVFNVFPREQKHRTYLQIDGQFIRYTHPKGFVVQKSDLSRTGTIRILRRVPLERQKGCCC